MPPNDIRVRGIPFIVRHTQAILAGTKRTHRIRLDAQPHDLTALRVDRQDARGRWSSAYEWRSNAGRYVEDVALPVEVDDWIFVKEATFVSRDGPIDWTVRSTRMRCPDGYAHVAYRADETDWRYERAWRSPANCARWASRATLVVEDVRVHRLREMTTADCFFEGSAGTAEMRTIDRFRADWDLRYGAGDAARNPWVAAVEFRLRLGNVDDLLRDREVAA